MEMYVLAWIVVGLFLKTSESTQLNQSVGCTNDVNITFFDFPPYLTHGKATSQSKSRGLAYSGPLYDAILHSTFPIASRIENGRSTLATSLNEIIQLIEDEKINFAFGIPANVYEHFSQTIKDTWKFIPTMESEQLSLVVNTKQCRIMLSEIIFKMIWKQWPIFTLMLLLAAVAGIAIWVLESRQQEKEFSRSFFRGIFDGFWWAFISMTTVGYGDKTPRTFIGRIFAVLWIIIGIIFVAFFTATITSAITIATVEKTCEKLENRQVGVLNGTKAKSFADDKRARIKEYYNFENMFSHLLDGQRDMNAILIDKLFFLQKGYSYSKEKVSNIKIIKNLDLNNPAILLYSMVKRYNVTEQRRRPCYEDLPWKQILDLKGAIDSEKYKDFKTEMAPNFDEELDQPLSFKSPETQPLLYILLGSFIGLAMVGFVGNIIFHRGCSKKKSTTDNETLFVELTSTTATPARQQVPLLEAKTISHLEEDIKELKELLVSTINKLSKLEKD